MAPRPRCCCTVATSFRGCPRATRSGCTSHPWPRPARARRCAAACPCAFLNLPSVARCPRTAALLESLPMADQDSFAPTAMFSALQPHTHILLVDALIDGDGGAVGDVLA